MGRSRNRIASTVVLLTLVLSVTTGAQEFPGGVAQQQVGPGTRLIEEVPIDGLLKVVTSSGEVVFLSKNRRFVFRGTMTDLWQGEALGIAPTENRIDLNRNGVDAESISVSIGDGDEVLTVFLAPECESCSALVELMLDESMLSRHRYRVVLLSSTREGEMSNRLVWCSERPEEALRSIYVEGMVPRSLKSPGSECNQFGLLLAQQAAMAFGIAQLPTIATLEGEASAGIDAAVAQLRIGETQ